MSRVPVWQQALFVTVLLAVIVVTSGRYDPTWESLDTRPAPTWYDEAKFGIFLHWGVFSVPSFQSEWFWYNWQGSKSVDVINFMKKNYPPNFTYADFAPMFTAELYEPNQWANIFKASGAKYLVFVSKHHEGFCNWPSKVSFNWNSMDVGPKRDLLGELASAIRNNTDIRFGVYHSLLEWFHPLYQLDKKSFFKTQKFVESKTLPELYELVNNYHPDIVWSDGDWEAPSFYWNATQFLAWLYNDSPVKDTVLVNDRWGIETRCVHGDFWNCQDKFNPGVLQKHKWENCMTVDRGSWGFRRDAKLDDLLTINEIIKMMAETVSCGGNFLLNVGPTHDGRISPIFEERLRQTGEWMQVNGEAIYASKPWAYQNDTLTPGVWYTSKKSTEGTVVYAILLSWPTGDTLSLAGPSATSQTTINLLGYSGPSFTWKSRSSGGVDIQIPVIPALDMPVPWAGAWVLKFTHLSN